MSYQLFASHFKNKINEARELQKEELALGFVSNKFGYWKRVGIVKGYDDAVAFIEQTLKDFAAGEVQ